MIKNLSECKESKEYPGIFLQDIPKGSIKQILLGYKYAESDIIEDYEKIRNFDADISVCRAVVDRQLKKIGFEPI
jgi:hypothetical protein